MKAAMEYIYNGLKAFWGVQNNIKKGLLEAETNLQKSQSQEDFTVNTKIEEVIKYPAFKDFGRLLFPTNKNYYSGDT
ncbi:MAG: Esterase/lipase-like protein, partial [Thermotoga sp. 47_83]